MRKIAPKPVTTGSPSSVTAVRQEPPRVPSLKRRGAISRAMSSKHLRHFIASSDVIRQNYRTEVRRQLQSIATRPADPRGTWVVVAAPLDIANVLTNERLLTQKIRFEGNSTMTCRQLRDGQVGGGDLS